MGWTSKPYLETTHLKFNIGHAAEFLNYEIGKDGYEIVIANLDKAQSSNHHNVIYTLLKHPTGYLFACVILIDIVNNEIYWKEECDSQGPVYDDCPKEILVMLDKNRLNDFAKDWYNRCEVKNISIISKPFIQSSSVS